MCHDIFGTKAYMEMVLWNGFENRIYHVSVKK